MATLVMRVKKYMPRRLYGFAHNAEAEVFFYASIFTPGEHRGGDPPVPPIVGEEVCVEVDLPEEIPDKGSPAPRAVKVIRLNPPKHVRGIVERFDSARGYGFISGEDGTSYYLHRSEVLDGKLPMQGDHASFVAGWSRDRARACYVDVWAGTT